MEVAKEPTISQTPAVRQEPTISQRPIIQERPTVSNQPKVEQAPTVSRQQQMEQRPTVSQQPKIKQKPTVWATQPLGRDHTGRYVPNNLNEQLAMEQVMSNPSGGKELTVPMTDPRWRANEGWVRMAQHVNGVEIHYNRNQRTGQVDDFKFKN